MNKKLQIIFLCVTALILCSSNSKLVPKGWAFGDVSGQVNEVADRFTDEGLLGSFIYKYGRDRFRPTGNVSREDLILVLGEYHNLITRIMSQNNRIMAQLDEMGAGSGIDTDTMIREFQSVLDPMLQNSRTIRELEQQIGQIDGVPSDAFDDPPEVAAFDDEELRRDIRNLEKKIEELKEADAGSEQVMAKIDLLEAQLERQNRELKKTDSGSEKVLAQIERLETQIESQNRELKRIARSGGSGEGASFPFWARTSVGISTLALFFMAR